MMATIIDSLIVVLLIGSIGYGYVVSMKLRKLTATLKQLEPLVEQFSSAVDTCAKASKPRNVRRPPSKRLPRPKKQPPLSPAAARPSKRRQNAMACVWYGIKKRWCARFLKILLRQRADRCLDQVC